MTFTAIVRNEYNERYFCAVHMYRLSACVESCTIVHDDRRNSTIKFVVFFFLNEYRQLDVMRMGRMH